MTQEDINKLSARISNASENWCTIEITLGDDFVIKTVRAHYEETHDIFDEWDPDSKYYNPD